MTPQEEARGFNPPEQHRLWRDRLLPRSIIPLFWLAWLLLIPARIIGAFHRKATEHRMAIESGIVGWTHVYFEELLASAHERYGDASVAKQIIDRDRPYLPQMRANMRRDRPSHVVLDVRTPGQTWPATLWQAYATAWHLLSHGMTPIVVLTDAFYRRQRWHAAVLTAFNGVVVTFAHEDIVRSIFPHRRIIGPLPMPISKARLVWLEQERAKREAPALPRVQFIGSVYPPRDTFLDVVGAQLAERGITLHVNREKAATSNETYWRTLIDADIVLTTTLQGPSRPNMDWIWVQQAVFRYAESTAAGAALVAGPVDGGFWAFQDGEDFLEFQSVPEAIDAVTRLATDAELRHRIARHGHDTSRTLIIEQAFWRAIDHALGSPTST